MNLDDRARVHFALGDVVRLGVVERLSVTDGSPGELARELAVPSNLLAHHLRVLEEAGLIRRTRSEGDGRRTYVTLRTDAPLLVAVLAATERRPALPAQGRVLFVCTHNSARSQLAAQAWSQVSDLPAASAGTHPAARVHPGAVRVGRRHGLTMAKAGTHHLADVRQPDDLVVAVCDQVHEELPDEDRLHWSVPDPARGRARPGDFEAAYADLSARIGRLATALDHPTT